MNIEVFDIVEIEQSETEINWCIDCAAPKGEFLNSGCPTCDS